MSVVMQQRVVINRVLLPHTLYSPALVSTDTRIENKC
jgi:hypothetical protein